MLYLLLDVGPDTYALATAAVVEVVPYATLKPAPGAPPAVVGILNFRGQAVPVVDCGVLLAGRCSPLRFSTRLILQRLEIAGSERILGLVGENVTRVQTFEDSEFVEPGACAADFPYAGRVVAYEGRWIQRLHLESVLSPEVWATLTTETA